MENLNTGQRPPKTWLLESILATIFCCMPFGIVGIVHAARVESRFYAGDITGANQASAEAGKWTKISAIVWAVCFVLYLVFFFFLGGAALWAAMQNQ